MSEPLREDRDTYKRGQVELALWQTLRLPVLGSPRDVHPVFRTRIKRLLELDRSGRLFETEVEPDSPFAFASAETDGTGHDATFGAFDAFCLAIALELLDAGFKQKEVVFLLRFIRGYLSSHYENALRNPPPQRSIRLAPSPTDREAARARDRDTKSGPGTFIFMILRRVELAELLPGSANRVGSTEAPSYLEPIFCAGHEQLREHLSRSMPERYRKAMVLEIALLAAQLLGFLKRAPLQSRGRPPLLKT